MFCILLHHFHNNAATNKRLRTLGILLQQAKSILTTELLVPVPLKLNEDQLAQLKAELHSLRVLLTDIEVRIMEVQEAVNLYTVPGNP